MREEVERFGGTVAQLTGDGVLALFEAPTGHEDDSARAVRAALAIHESLARYAAGEQVAVVPLAYGERQLWRRPWVTGMWVNAVAMSSFAEAVVRPELRSARSRG